MDSGNLGYRIEESGNLDVYEIACMHIYIYIYMYS